MRARAAIGALLRHGADATATDARTKNYGVRLPSRRVAQGRGLGSGSGSTAVAIAMSLCEHVDAFGFGVFRDNATARDYRYLHFYQRTPKVKDATTGGAQVLNSELRNMVWDAFGLANFIWW